MPVLIWRLVMEPTSFSLTKISSFICGYGKEDDCQTVSQIRKRLRIWAAVTDFRIPGKPS
jgi:hypothetical protein